VMLVRNQPAKKDQILSHFGSDTARLIGEIASTDTAINSHLLLRLLQAADQISRSPVPHLPLEIAIMELGSS